jgi:uncharacterized protein YheU (UPF0270 family)
MHELETTIKNLVEAFVTAQKHQRHLSLSPNVTRQRSALKVHEGFVFVCWNPFSELMHLA